MGFCAKTSTLATILIVIAVNCLLLAGGIIVLYVAVKVHDAGWMDILRTYVSSTDSIVTGLMVVGGIICGLAVLGSISAVCRWRFGLWIYAVVLFLMMVLFAVIAAGSFILHGTASDWADSSYPYNDDEVSVKTEFDQLYCYAQGEYICDDMSVQDALDMFVPSLSSSVTALFANVSGITTLCDEYLTEVSSLEAVCNGCELASQFKNLSSILDWANDKCPRTNETLIWCGEFLADGTTNSTLGTAPYTQCRDPFLDLVESGTFNLGLGSIFVCIGSLLVIIFACCLRRRNRSNSHYETH